jgi:hypothetical protein
MTSGVVRHARQRCNVELGRSTLAPRDSQPCLGHGWGRTATPRQPWIRLRRKRFAHGCFAGAQHDVRAGGVLRCIGEPAFPCQMAIYCGGADLPRPGTGSGRQKCGRGCRPPGYWSPEPAITDEWRARDQPLPSSMAAERGEHRSIRWRDRNICRSLQARLLTE